MLSSLDAAMMQEDLSDNAGKATMCCSEEQAKRHYDYILQASSSRPLCMTTQQAHLLLVTSLQAQSPTANTRK